MPLSTVLCRGFTVLGPAPRRQYRDAGARLLTVVNDYDEQAHSRLSEGHCLQHHGVINELIYQIFVDCGIKSSLF